MKRNTFGNIDWDVSGFGNIDWDVSGFGNTQ
jgi:hypothetical protein